MLKSTKSSSSGQLNSRPRRFSLLYSSSDEDDEYDHDILKQRRKSKSISKNLKPDIKMTALRNKLKLLQKVNNSENNDNVVQSNVKKRNLNINISNSSSSESSSDSDDDKPINPLGSNIKLNNAEHQSNQSSKKLEQTSDELNEDDLIKAIESESDAEKQQADVDYLDIDLDQNFDEFIKKQSNDSNEIFTNVAINSLNQDQSSISASKSDNNIFVPHEDDDEDENDPDMNLMLQADHVETKGDDSDEDYDEMLLEAALLTDSEDNNRHTMINASNNTSDNDVFMNVDDLDPHSFYFEDQEDSDLEKTNKHVMDLDFDTRVPEKESKKQPHRETKDNNYHHNAFFPDEESTDEEDSLPAISKKIKTRTRSFHNSHDAHLGKALPKLNFWKTDKKRPFSIIDGLSTKSLFSITIVDDTNDTNGNKLINQNLLTPAAKVANHQPTPNIKINIHEKLMAEASSLDNTPRQDKATSVNEDFPVDQLLAISSGSEQEHDFVDSSATNSDMDVPRPHKKAEEINMIIHQDNNDENDLFTKDGMESLINNEVIIEIPSEMNFHPLEQFRRNSVSELQPHLASLDSFYQNEGHRRGSFVKDRFRNSSIVMDNSDLELIQKLTKNTDPQHSNNHDLKRKESIIMDEAKLEKLRITKSGLFSEAAMNSLEEFVNSNSNKNTKNRRYSTNKVPKSNNNGSNVAFEIDNFTF
ncbi:hypothetical protein ACO0R3_002948 [Hanseniaspora guilliermondii]